jgi:hypothetical protein
VAADGELVLTRDLSSGKIHKRVVIGKRLATLEGCNLDQSGAYEIIPAVDLDDEDPKNICQRCFEEELSAQ